MSSSTGQPTVERKSVSVNQDYKSRLNELSELTNRLEKIRRTLYPVNLEPSTQGIEGLKKSSPDTTFLEIWEDHTDYFKSLLNRLDKVVQELEQF